MDIQPWHAVIIVIVAVAEIALLIWALVTIIKHPDASTTAKVVWILIIIIFPVLGSAIWLVTGRSALLKKNGA